MAYRRQEILFSMLLDCGKPSEIRKYSELLQNNKGSATVFCLRVIKKKWDEFYRGKITAESAIEESEDTYNGVKISHWSLKDFKN